MVKSVCERGRVCAQGVCALARFRLQTPPWSQARGALTRASGLCGLEAHAHRRVGLNWGISDAEKPMDSTRTQQTHDTIDHLTDLESGSEFEC